MRAFIYWIKFDKDPRPERVYSNSYEDFRNALEQMIFQRGEMPEWLVRDYTK